MSPLMFRFKKGDLDVATFIEKVDGGGGARLISRDERIFVTLLRIYERFNFLFCFWRDSTALLRAFY